MSSSLTEPIGSQANTNTYIFFLVIMPIILFVMAGWYFKRMSMSPIKERPHSLIYATVLPFFVMGMEFAFINVLGKDKIYCFPVVLIMATTYVSCASALLVRILLMYWEFQMTQKKLDFAAGSLESEIFSEARLEEFKNEVSKMKFKSKWMHFGAVLSWLIGFIATTVTFAAEKVHFDILMYDGNDDCIRVLEKSLIFWFLPDLLLQCLAMIWLCTKCAQHETTST
jgi:membrane-associated HD superfamily phosphohydrolase